MWYNYIIMSKSRIELVSQLVSQKSQTTRNMSVIRASDLEVSNVVHDKIKPKGKGKFVKMNYKNGMIRIQIPNARVPFGLSIYENENDKSKKYSLEISLGGDDKLDAFREQLEEIDQLNINTIVENSKAWLGENKAKPVVEGAIYSSLIKPDKKGESPSRFKLKLPVWDGKPMFSVYEKGERTPMQLVAPDADGNPVINWDWAQNGMEVTIIAECEGLWVVSKNVYCTWRVASVKINKKSNRVTDYAFMDEEDTDSVKESGDTGDGNGNGNSNGKESEEENISEEEEEDVSGDEE